MMYDEYIALGFYNVIFTALPVLAYGFFEQDVSPRLSTVFPLMYRPGQNDAVLNFPRFLFWVLEAIYHACVAYFITYFAISNAPMANGQNIGLWDSGNICFTANLFIVTIRMAWDIQHFTSIHWVFLIVTSILFWFGFMLLYCAWDPSMDMTLYGSQYWSLEKLSAFSLFWLTNLLAVVVGMLPVVIRDSWAVCMTPTVGAKSTNFDTMMEKVIPDAMGDASLLYHIRHYQHNPDLLIGEQKIKYEAARRLDCGDERTEEDKNASHWCCC